MRNYTRKLTALVLMICALAAPAVAYAASTNAMIAVSKPESSVTAWDEANPEALVQSNLYAQSALLIDARSGTVLFSKNPNTQLNPASITKILTALVVLEKCSLDEVITVNLSAMGPLEATWVPLMDGEQVTVRDLLYGMMLRSYNDAAAALAVHAGGSLSGFAELMNRKALELGCTDSHFVMPHGLTIDNHQTTVGDMAKIMRAAMQNETFRQIIVTPSYTIPAFGDKRNEVVAQNTNKMLPDSGTEYAYEGCIGGKSGYTIAAQHTYVVAAQRDGVYLIAVVMGTMGPDPLRGDSKWTDARKLLDYGFSMYQKVDVGALYAANPFECQVDQCIDGDSGTLRLELGELGGLGGIIARKDSDAFDPNVFRQNVQVDYISDRLSAPIEKGQKIAEMTYHYGDGQSVSVDLLASRDIVQMAAPALDGDLGIYQGTSVMPPTLTDIASGIEHSPARYLALLLLVPVLILIGLVISMMVDVSRRRKRLRGRISRTRSGYY